MRIKSSPRISIVSWFSEAPFGKKQKQRFFWTFFSSSFVIISSVFFTYTKSEFSDLSTVISGIDRFDHLKEYYMVGYLPRNSNYSVFSQISLFIDCQDPRETENYALEAIFTISRKNENRIIINQNIPSVICGFTELYSSGFPQFDVMAYQIFLKGEFHRNNSISMRLRRSSPSFIERVFHFKYVLIFSLAIILVSFVASLVIIEQYIEINQYIALISMLSTLISVYLFGSNENIYMHCADLIFRGISASTNLVSIFCLSYTYVSGDNIAATLTLLSLFIIADGIRSLTTDTFVLAEFFQNNGVIWVFFFSTSIVTKISLILLVSHHLVYAFLFGPLHSRFRVFLTAIVCFVCISPRIFRLGHLAVTENENSALNFLCDILMQVIVCSLVSVLVWPIKDNEIETTTSTEKFHITDDESLAGLFGRSVEESDSDL